MPGAFRMDSAATVYESVASAWRFWLMMVVLAVVGTSRTGSDNRKRTNAATSQLSCQIQQTLPFERS